MAQLLANLQQTVLLLHKLLLLFLTRWRHAVGHLFREIISLLHIGIHHSKWVSTVMVVGWTSSGAHRVNHSLSRWLFHELLNIEFPRTFFIKISIIIILEN